MKLKQRPIKMKNTNAIKITNEYNQNNIKDYSPIINDFSQIKEQIISEIKKELFIQNKETIMTNYKSVIKMLEIDIISKCNTDKGMKINQDILSKKFECFLSYINEREKEGEEIKLKTIDTLSNYFNQLSDIILNYFLSHKEDTDTKEKTHHKGEILDEKFVVQINMLSKLIKSYTSKAQLISKLSSHLLEKMNAKLLLCKTISSDIYIQSSIINRANIKTIQLKEITLNETLESVLSFHSEITNKSIAIESNHNSFYTEAKDIFRKLKSLQNEFKAKIMTQEVTISENNINQIIQTNAPITKTKPIINLLSKQKQLMSRSTDHFNHSQKIYLNNINNSFNEACILNSSPVDTDPQDMAIHLNNTDGSQSRGGLHLNKIISIKDLIEKNKCLRTEVDNLNHTMTKTNFERKRLKKELDEIKKHVQKRTTFRTSVNTVTRHNDSCNNNKSNCCKNDYLAKRIIDFMQNMKDLQDSICKKEKNVSQKKKEFEKKKKELLSIANDYKDKISASSIEKEDINHETETKKEEENQIQELKKQNDKLVVELKMKNAELNKIHETNNKKQNESKKNNIPMAKLKEFENIIKTLKNQIDLLKEEKKELEKINLEFKQEISKIKQELDIKEKETISKEIKQNKDKCTFLTTCCLSLVTKMRNIYTLLTPEKQSNNFFIILKEIDNDGLNKIDIAYTEITTVLTNILFEQKTKQQQGSTSSTVTPCKTPQTIFPSQSLIEENKKLKTLFEECMSTIYSSIKDHVPETFEEDDDLSFNYGSGLNTPVNLLDSNNLNRNQSATATIDKESIQEAVEMFIKYNAHIHNELQQLKEEKQKIDKENELLLLRSETYKKALEDSIKKNQSLNEKEFIIDFNKTTKKFTLQDIAEINSETNQQKDNFIASSKELIKTNNKLKQKVKLLEEELKLKTQAFTESVRKKHKQDTQIKTTSTNQDNDFKELYLKAENRIKELEEQYQNLVKEIINGETDEENKEEKRSHDTRKVNYKNENFMQMINSHHFTNDNHNLNTNVNSKMVSTTKYITNQ